MSSSPPRQPPDLDDRPDPWRYLILATALVMGSLFIFVIYTFTRGPSRGEDCLVVLQARCGGPSLELRVRNECPEDIDLGPAELVIVDAEGDSLPGTRTELAWEGAQTIPRATTEDRRLVVPGGGALPSSGSGGSAVRLRITLESVLWDDKGTERTELSCEG